MAHTMKLTGTSDACLCPYLIWWLPMLKPALMAAYAQTCSGGCLCSNLLWWPAYKQTCIYCMPIPIPALVATFKLISSQKVAYACNYIGDFLCPYLLWWPPRCTPTTPAPLVRWWWTSHQDSTSSVLAGCWQHYQSIQLYTNLRTRYQALYALYKTKIA